MAMKEWLQWLPPPRSLLALLLAMAGFSGRLFASHFTHSPTLLVDACHSLCRLVGLVTTLIAYKYERADENTGREGRLRNTFGWARIEVVGRLSVHVLFASFALALVVNAMQLGVHSTHTHGQPPRLPRIIVGCAVIGLLLYAINYLLLAGRELSYSRRLSMTEDGEVVLKTGAGEPVLAHAPTDIASSLFVMAAGLTLEWEPEASRIADPAISACAAIILVIFNYPFRWDVCTEASTCGWTFALRNSPLPLWNTGALKVNLSSQMCWLLYLVNTLRSAGLILLQTVPEGLGTCELRAAALKVPGVLAIHELHVWQLHRDRVVATAHIAYHSHEDYLKSSALVNDVFKKHGIGLVTLQPEFSLVGKTGDERKMLVEFANLACSSPCAKECIAPKCCEPSGKPAITKI